MSKYSGTFGGLLRGVTDMGSSRAGLDKGLGGYTGLALLHVLGSATRGSHSEVTARLVLALIGLLEWCSLRDQCSPFSEREILLLGKLLPSQGYAPWNERFSPGTRRFARLAGDRPTGLPRG